MSSLVSVICICHNHEKFVEEALVSVMQQSHRPIELWVIDNGSEDKSADKIKSLLKIYPDIQFVYHPKAIGYTRAFNQVLAQAKGDFIIDLAADDVLLPHRIEEGVKGLEQAGKAFGVHFSDGSMIDEMGNELGLHSDRFPHASVVLGDIYKELVERYFILTPSMMIRSEVLKELQGYDESLAYEDFDFWVRSARITQYRYSPLVLVKKRVVVGSMSTQQYRFGSTYLLSTLKVCQKAWKLNQSGQENQALRKRIYYETWQVLKLGRIDIAFRYLLLLLRTFARKS